MGLSVCPAAIVAAPVEQVWQLLQPVRLSEWIDGRIEGSVPEGAPFVGQTFSAVSRAFGRDWRSDFIVEKVDAMRHQLAMHVRFPFGMQLHEHVACNADRRHLVPRPIWLRLRLPARLARQAS